MKNLIIEWENPLVGIVKIVKQEEQKGENIITSTLKELGINIVELLAREQLYRQKKVPREISDIIESYLVENVRFVNTLKRNIFTEKKLSKELRKEIEKLISYYKIYNLIKREYGELRTSTENLTKPVNIDIDWKIFERLELPTIPEDLRIRKGRIGDVASLKFSELPGNWFKGKNTKKPLIDKITLELEAKKRIENIKRIEKEQLKPERGELERLSKSLTEKEKSINSKLTEREEQIRETEKKLEKEKAAIEGKIPTITAEAEKEKAEAIRNLEKEKQEKINELETATKQKEQELNTKIQELEQAKAQIENQLTNEKTAAIQKLEAEKGVIISQLEQEKKNLEGKERTASGKINQLENRIRELDKEIQHWNKESEILRKAINKKLPWRQEGETLREATYNLINKHSITVNQLPSTGEKCVQVVTAPFRWVANKTSTGFALVGFGVSIPAICGAIGWGLKAFLAVKTGGVGGAIMVADSLISQSQKKKLGENNNQGGNLPPNYQPLPQGNNNVNNQLLPARRKRRK